MSSKASIDGSGDWRLLNNIESEFANSYQVKIEPLFTNYRSDRNIIDFNNAFFTTMSDQEYLALQEKKENGVASSDHTDNEAQQLKKLIVMFAREYQTRRVMLDMFAYICWLPLSLLTLTTKKVAKTG